jgi:hypothetical protein
VNRAVFCCWIGVALSLVSGCAREPEVAHISVKRPELVGGKPPAPPAREKERLLAAMIPGGAETWFFRMSGPEAAVKEFEPQFDAIVQSLKFADPDLPKWKLPDGWIEEAPKKQFILKNLRPADDAKNIAVTVSRAGGGELPNINRWRGQLGLPPAGKDDLAGFSKEIEVDGRKGRIVDLVGFAKAGKGMGGPMAGQMPKGHPAIPAGNPEDAKVTYTLPKDWTKVAPNNAMIREQLTVTENGDKAEITITVLPGRGGDPLANVNRWRGQIKLPPIDDVELFKSLTRIETQGLPAAMVDLTNPQIPAPNRILGVMIPTPGAMWFLKMRGPDAFVGRQKSNFEAFTRSFKIEN